MFTHPWRLAPCAAVAMLCWTSAFAQTPAPAPTTEPAPEVSAADAERAKQIYANGVSLYEEARYSESILAFREALILSGRKPLLYNIANAQERLGDLKGAIDSLNTYRVYATPDETDTLLRRISALERRYDDERSKEAAAAAALAATPAPAPEPVVVSTALLAPATRANGAKWALVGIGGGVAVASGTVAAITYTQSRAQADAHDQAAYESTKAVNNGALIGTGVGAALAVVGLAMPARINARVTVLPTPSGAIASARF